jgi:hypothetical protein
LNLREQLIREIDYLINLNYSIDEIIEILKEKYNINEELLKDIIEKKYSLIYVFYNKVNKPLLLIGFLSFLISAMLFNNALLASYFLAFVFYVVIVLDYLSFAGRINYNLSNFFSFLSIFSFLVISLLAIKKYIFIPTVSLSSLIDSGLKFIKKQTFKNLGRDFIIDFFYNILVNSLYFLLIFILLLFPLLLGNLLYFLIFFIISLIFLFYKKRKISFSFILISFVLFFYFASSLNKITLAAKTSFENLYDVKLNSKIFYPFLEVENYYFKINSSKKNSNNKINESKLNMYKLVVLNKISKLEKCKVEIKEFGYNPSNLVDFLIFSFSDRDYFIKKFERKLSVIHKKYLNLVKEKVKTSKDYESLKKLTLKLNLIEIVVCNNEK